MVCAFKVWTTTNRYAAMQWSFLGYESRVDASAHAGQPQTDMLPCTGTHSLGVHLARRLIIGTCFMLEPSGYTNKTQREVVHTVTGEEDKCVRDAAAMQTLALKSQKRQELEAPLNFGVLPHLGSHETMTATTIPDLRTPMPRR